MAEVNPFAALRFTPGAGKLDELVCPPYDIISETQREAYLARNPRNIIRLELPRDGADPYRAAGDTLTAWLDEQVLAVDETPGYYLYEEQFTVGGESKRIKGLVGAVRLEEWEKGVVLPHEETLSKAKKDRFQLMCATGCNFSSIYSLYFDENGNAARRIDALSAGAPDQEFVSDDGIVHRVWKVTDAADIAALQSFFAAKTLYIADGHHRYETALNYRNHLREQGVVTTADHPANFVMMTVVAMEHPGLVVQPTHRIVHSLSDFDGDMLLGGCAEHFTVGAIAPEGAEEALSIAEKAGKTAFALLLPGAAHLLELRGEGVPEAMLPGTSDAYRALDVSVLHTMVLDRLLGIDKANMLAQRNLSYTRTAAEALEAVAEGKANCAILLNATGVEEIAAVAAHGEKMPQKSTYFYPKLITGHLMRRADE